MLNFSLTLHVSSLSPPPAPSSPLLPFYAAATYSPPRNFSVTTSSPPSSSSSLSSSLVLLPHPSCFSRPARVSVGNMAELVRNAAGNGKDKPVVVHSRTFVEARSHQELLSGIKKLAKEGKLSPHVAAGMEELFHTYKNAVQKSGIPGADEVVLSNMSATLDRVLFDVEDPFVFAPHHKALREPFDYYVFGQNYLRPLINFRTSYVGNIGIFNEIQEKLRQLYNIADHLMGIHGHNIVLMSNHQTEADPAFIALLLESKHEDIAQNLIYVAGDRVLTDPLSKPFSMGRNLFCVYSKKHIFDVPELAEMKKKANIRSLKEMALVLRGGSQIVWIAPSGGRDRADPATGEWNPAPFDPSSVDNMRRLVENSGVPGHVYPLSLLCYEIMPPPAQVEKEIGERRVLSFNGAGLSVAPEINSGEVTVNCKNPEEAKEAYTRAVYGSVVKQYEVLKAAIQGQKGLKASTEYVTLSQPWN